MVDRQRRRAGQVLDRQLVAVTVTSIVAIIVGVVVIVGMAIRTGGRGTHSTTGLAMISTAARTIPELYGAVLDRESEPLRVR